MNWNIFILILLLLAAMSYSRRDCGGITKKRKKMYSSRKRGKRRTQVHEKGEKSSTETRNSPVAPPVVPVEDKIEER